MKHLKLTFLSWIQRALSIGGAFVVMRLVSQGHGDAGVIFIGVAAAVSGWIGMFDLGSFSVTSQLASHCYRGGRWRSSAAFASLGIGLAAMFLMVAMVVVWGVFGPGWPAALLNQADAYWLSILFLFSAMGIGGTLGWRWKLAHADPCSVVGFQIIAQIIGVGSAISYLMWKAIGSDLAVVSLLTLVPQLIVQQWYLWSAVIEGGAKVWTSIGGISARIRGVLVRRHGKSLLFSLLCAAIHQSDVLMVAFMVNKDKALGAALAGYILSSKMFFSFMPIISASLQSHAPALTRSWSDRDHIGIRKMVNQILAANTLAVGLFTLVLVTQRFWIFPLLSPGSSIVPPPDLLLLFGVYLLLRVWTDLWSQMLLGASDYWSNISIASVQAVITLVLMLTIVPSWGGHGAVLALILGFLATASWFLPWRVKQELGHLPFWR